MREAGLTQWDREKLAYGVFEGMCAKLALLHLCHKE